MIVSHAGVWCVHVLLLSRGLVRPLHSGCITSAESVLITMQSHTEVLHVLENNPPPSFLHHKIPVISIAPQCLASLAASISSSSSQNISLLQVLRRVSAFCREVLGFVEVYDTTFARHISLLEHAKEFNERKAGEGRLPMLASACPGWVCYAEKTHAEMLPFISRTKSPQQVMGALVKEWLGSKWGKTCVHPPCLHSTVGAVYADRPSRIFSSGLTADPRAYTHPTPRHTPPAPTRSTTSR